MICGIWRTIHNYLWDNREKLSARGPWWCGRNVTDWGGAGLGTPLLASLTVGSWASCFIFPEPLSTLTCKRGPPWWAVVEIREKSCITITAILLVFCEYWMREWMSGAYSCCMFYLPKHKYKPCQKLKFLSHFSPVLWGKVLKSA